MIILTILISIFIFITIYTQFQNNEKKKKRNRFITIIIGILTLIALFSQGTIQQVLDPWIYNLLKDSKIEISLNYKPILAPEGDYITLEISSEGPAVYEDIVVDYTFGMGFADNEVKDRIFFPKLPKTFKIYPRDPLNCTMPYGSYSGEIYMDILTGKKYHNNSLFGRQFCILKRIDFWIVATNKFGGKESFNFTYFYPVEGSVSGAYIFNFGDLDYGAYEYLSKDVDLQNLFKFGEYSLTEFINYPPALCMSRELPIEYCASFGGEYSVEPSYIIEINDISGFSYRKQDSLVVPPKY